MTKPNPALLPVNNGESIRTFKVDDAHINHKAIEVYQEFRIVGVEANKTYIWDFSNIGFDIKPLSLLGGKDTNITNNEDLRIRARDRGSNNITWELNLTGSLNTLGNSFYVEFPFLAVSPNLNIELISDTALTGIIIWSERIVIESPSYTPSYTL